jgi:hypothetical protein
MIRLAMILGLFGVAPRAILSDDAPKPDAVDRVLKEWHEHASKLTTLKVGFRATNYDSAFGNTESAGWLWLAKPNLAQLDHYDLDSQKKPSESPHRMVWSGRSTTFFQNNSPCASRYHYLEEQHCPPRFLSRLFLFGISVDQAKQEHDWSIVRENASEVVLRATKKSRDKPASGFFFDLNSIVESSIFSFDVSLDKKSFLPTCILVYPDPPLDFYRGGRAYHLTVVQPDAAFDLEPIKHPKLGDRKLVEDYERPTGEFLETIRKVILKAR